MGDQIDESASEAEQHGTEHHTADQQTADHQVAMGSAAAVLGGGAALTAVSTTLNEGTVPLVMMVIGVVLIAFGAAMLGKAIREGKAAEQA